MKRRILYILIFVCLFCLINMAMAQEASENPFGLSAAEMTLFTRINEARTNPLGTAEALGMNRDEILENLPELREILINGLPAFELNEMLVNAARSHTNDMFDRDYYSHVNPDGQSWPERISESGYAAAVSGETLGLIGFLSFIEDATAAESIFQNIFTDELNPDRVENRNILNPDLKEIGLAMSSGVLTANNNSFNAFAATCNFGAQKAEDVSLDQVEKELFVLINQFRDNPEMVAAAYGLDATVLRQAVTGQTDEALENLPPLGSHEKLAQTAKAHTLDMIGHRYYSTTTLEGIAPELRIHAAGYEAQNVQETLGLLNRLPLVHSTEDIARMFFESLLHDALNSETPDESPLFNNQVNEFGMGAGVLVIDEGEGSVAYYVLTIDAAQSAEDRFTLSGVVFRDANGNGLYDAGEGAGKRSLIALGRWPNVQISCDDLGAYSTVIDPAYYILMLFREFENEEQQLKQAALPGKNDWVTFTVDQVFAPEESI